jgi:ligand-binding sensor domain-containing protein
LRNILFCVLISLITEQVVLSDGYQFLQYRVEDGLKTDIIKTIHRDSLGFIWIGSDEGLMQFNGSSFVHYPYASASTFIKQLIRLRNGRLLALNDLGLVEIVNKIDTVLFNTVLPGSRVPTDTSLWYPKSIFEDSRGNIWVGEPQSVVRYDGQEISRIEFGPEDNSSSFVRSFTFAELPDGRILICSFNGNFYTYQNDTGAFVFLEQSDSISEINHMIYWNDRIYLGCSSGVYRSEVLTDNEISFSKLSGNVNTAHLLPISKSELLVSSFTDASLMYETQRDSFSELPFQLTVVNSAHLSESGNLWLATEKGVVLLKPQIFQKIQTDSDNIYVESVALPPEREKVFFSSKEHIRVYELGADAAMIFDVKRLGYFLSLQYSDDHLWASNGFDIYRYNLTGEIVDRWNFEEYGRYIFDLVIDKEKNVWFTQEASEGLKMITQDGKVKLYGRSQGLENELTIVRLGENGIYCGSNDPEAYV